MSTNEPQITQVIPFSVRLANSIIIDNPYWRKHKVVNKKQEQKRIAKAKMYASWKTVNHKTPTVHHIKQVCKPHHKLKSNF